MRFITAIESWEPNGPVTVDLVTLADGRVLGINDECVVLYPSREAFENSGHEREKKQVVTGKPANIRPSPLRCPYPAIAWIRKRSSP